MRSIGLALACLGAAFIGCDGDTNNTGTTGQGGSGQGGSGQGGSGQGGSAQGGSAQGGAGGSVAPGDHVWSLRFGDATFDDGAGVAADAMGDILLTGTFHGSIDFGGPTMASAGDQDIYLAKLDGSGNHLWSQRFGNTASDLVSRPAMDGSGNLLITGGVTGLVDFGGGVVGPIDPAGLPDLDIFVAKYDDDGNHLWSNRYGTGSHEWAVDVATDSSGNVVIVGWFDGSADFGGGTLTSAGSSDCFVAKYDENGTHLWSEALGGTNIQRCFGVATDTSGNVIVAGGFFGTVDFGGGTLTSAGDQDVFVAKLDVDGNHVWSDRFGDVLGDLATGVTTDPAGNIVMIGGFFGTLDLGGATLGPLTGAEFAPFVVTLDSAGNHQWSKQLGDGAAPSELSQVAIDDSGTLLVTGLFGGTLDPGGGALTSAGGSDILAVMYDNLGNHVWSKALGGTVDDEGHGVAIDGSGQVLVTGFFGSTVDFGDGALTSTGETDVFVARFAP